MTSVAGSGVRLIPDRNAVVDMVFLAILVMLALVGFQTVYGGDDYLIAGGLGLVAGLLVGHVGAALRLPALAVTAASLVALILLAGVAGVRPTGSVGIVPTVDTVVGLADGAIRGWRQLLTSGQPVSASGNLLAVPYVIGLLAGVVGLMVAERTRRVAAVLIAPAVVLAVTILFGTPEPASLLAQGSLFAAIGLAWVAVRHRRLRPAAPRARSRPSRVVMGLGMLVLAGLGGLLIAPALPMANANDRLVLRDIVQPPFDPRTYPSPLSGLRSYLDLPADVPVLAVSGLPEGGRIRVAAMDAYDGVVWGVSGGADAEHGSGYFGRVGQVSPADFDGERAALSLQLGPAFPVQPWLPTAGETLSVQFTGEQAQTQERSLRYNPASDIAAVPALLGPGAAYAAEAVVAAPPTADVLSGAGLVGVGLPEPPVEAVPKELSALAQKWTEGKESDYQRAAAIQQQLIATGFLSDGRPGQTPSTPGHFSERLQSMVVDGGQMVGNDEQYAALAALMMRTVGVPSRVVLGFVPGLGAVRAAEAAGTEAPPLVAGGPTAISGPDVHAWVEVPFAGIGWVAFDVTPTSTQAPEARAAEAVSQENQTQNPPDPDVPPPVQSSTVDAPSDTRDQEAQGQGWLSALLATLTTVARVAFPVFIVLSPFLAILAVKARRRGRRRSASRAVDRIAGGWSEVVDHAVDRGVEMPEGGTRREVAAAVPMAAAQLLADDADAAVFGPTDPTDEEVERFWAAVEAALAESKHGMSRWQRIRASLALRSLLGPHGRAWPGALSAGGDR